MPVARNTKTLSTKQPRAGKGAPITENVAPEKVRPGWEDGGGPLTMGCPLRPLTLLCCRRRAARPSGPRPRPRGGPKKRSAFGDLTNVSAALWGGGCAALLRAPRGSLPPFFFFPPCLPRSPTPKPGSQEPGGGGEEGWGEIRPPQGAEGPRCQEQRSQPEKVSTQVRWGWGGRPLRPWGGGFLGVMGAGSGWMGFFSPPTYVLIPSRSLKKTPLTEESEESEKDPVPEEPVQAPVLEDIDKEQLGDPYANAQYAKDIFDYMREREENFELNHETLYLAVKLVDHYLVEVVSMKDKLQLIGSTAVLIASKFEEQCPPCVDDFLYICDDAYKREELVAMEKSILRTLNFDINIPIPYRFLRRFAKCARVNMETLTLARFLCEMTLQEYDYARERPSKLAASCLLLALTMKNLGGWTPTLEYYSGYRAQDLHPLVKRLNFLLTYQPCDKLKAVRTKYSHRLFFEVAKMTPLDMLKLEEKLKS
uniref:Uncharacterized protein n=1 Tax=Anas platyrhynchos platyrhynchos TaxID=8840 RepID=A0A493SX48_ANAPP